MPLSRQLAVYGVADQAKIQNSPVSGALGVEIAQNVCLVGVNAVTIADSKQVTLADENENFNLSPSWEARPLPDITPASHSCAPSDSEERMAKLIEATRAAKVPLRSIPIPRQQILTSSGCAGIAQF